ncbi:MAG: DegT/DnrJ/EryC1/StrS family aminotransferase [Coriobacteriia bacterium]|nr:DegT/DnrJ/EryC1/StrS family aminotransferase [Coriobacteriia bacterium]
MSVPFLDLTKQYVELKEASDALWFDVMNHSAFIAGPRVSGFEREIEEYLGVKHCISCANGTDALFLILQGLGISKGDEVITTPWTFFATLECITHVGATPVMVDILPDSYNIDPAAVEAAVTSRTRAILPVHIFGQCADMDAIDDIAKKHDLMVIEDACQAMGASYKGKMAGALADAAAFSFFPTKNLGCGGDGGCITTDNDELAEHCRLTANHGMPIKYIHTAFGVNSRLDALQAGLLSLRLTKLDEWNAQRGDAAAYYDKEFSKIKGVTVPAVDSTGTHIYHLYILKTDQASELLEFLQSRGIGSALYYPHSLHEQVVFESLSGWVKPSLPVSEDCAGKTIAIPCFPGITKEQCEETADAVKEFFATKS